MINVASLIKKMFFPGDQEKPLLKFAVIPDTIENSSTNYLLNLGGNSIDYSRDSKRTKNIVWPSKNSNDVWFELRKNKDKEVIMEEKGDWALFRLFS